MKDMCISQSDRCSLNCLINNINTLDCKCRDKYNRCNRNFKDVYKSLTISL